MPAWRRPCFISTSPRGAMTMPSKSSIISWRDSTMGAINDIFRMYAPEYIGLYGDAMPAEHKKVIGAIITCKTEENGSLVYECEECGEKHLLFRSCGNRHCPQCQSHKTRQWLERQITRQLPGHHFMVTFTVPQEIRDFIRSHQRIAYAALFAASSEAMRK